MAVNSKGHVFVFSRGNSTGPSYMATASQLLEFDANGKFIREIGKNLYAWSYAHAVRIDKDDNIWVVDKGSDMILKMNPQGRVVWVFGRKGEASHFMTPPDYASTLTGLLSRAGVAITAPAEQQPAQSGARAPRQRLQPADRRGVGFAGQLVLQRRLRQLARRQSERAWRVGRELGSLGNGPGQFDTPHGIAVSPKDEVFVADRGNRRIQVFDPSGKFLRQFTIDVPVDRPKGKVVFGQPAPTPRRARKRLERPTPSA